MTAATRDAIVLKLGGSCLDDMAHEWWDDLAELARHRPVVLAHGWSKPLRELRDRAGRRTDVLRDRWGNQSRWTTPDVIDDIRVVSETIAGQVRDHLERRDIDLTHVLGSDGLLSAGPAERWWWRDKRLQELTNLVGPITSVDVDRLPPVRPGACCLVTPLARDAAGRVVNTDADRAAAAVAAAMGARDLALVTDVPNVLVEGRAMTRMDAVRAADFRDHGATGGMRKKLRAAGEAIERGVQTVVIGNARTSQLLTGAHGTVITA